MSESEAMIDRLLKFSDENRKLRVELADAEAENKRLLSDLHWVVEYVSVFIQAPPIRLARNLLDNLRKYVTSDD